MTKFSWNDYQFLDLINFKEHEVDNLPKGVSISTMCCSAKIGSEINIENIQNYLQLNRNDILTVKLNDSKTGDPSMMDMMNQFSGYNSPSPLEV